MRVGGFFLLVSGWGIVLAALLLLHGTKVAPFILAGFATELLGLIIVGKAHLSRGEDNR